MCAASLVMSGLVIGWGVGPAGSASKVSGESWQAAPAAIVQAMTQPGIFYEGAEPCPYCAAERWAFIIAMARFGTWSKLGIAQSAANDIDPSTQTFTFFRATYSSPYVAVQTREILSSRMLPNGNFAPLQKPTREEAKLDSSYTSAKYFPTNPGYLPFVDFGNRVVISQSSYDPSILHGLSRAQIASDLSDPTSPVTMAIVATANYLSAATCLIDGDRPAAVCQSPGVGISAHFVKISSGFGPSSCATSKNGRSTCTSANAP